MRFSLSASLPCLLLPIVLLPSVASAETGYTSPDANYVGHTEGIEVGLRTAYGMPLGAAAGVGKSSSSSGSSGTTSTTSSASSPDLSDTVTAQIPIWLDLGYRATPNLYIGAFGSYGFGLLPTNVCKNISCSVNDIRVGLNAHWHFLPDARFDPWAGVGVGYEILGLSASQTVGGQSASVDTKLKGFEVANLQIGADYKFSPSLAMGPMITATLSQYSGGSVDVKSPIGSQSVDGDVNNPTWHAWLMFGIRGTFDIAIGDPPTAPPGARATTRPSSTPTPSATPVASSAASPPSSAPPSSSAHPSPAPSTPDAPQPPQPPGAWPASVGIADRTQCTYRCMNNGQAVDSGDLERLLSRQLGAIRQCSAQTSEYRTLSSDATFDADGRLTFSVDAAAARPAMRECIAKIPAPGYFKGPSNAHWKCSDYCQ